MSPAAVTRINPALDMSEDELLENVVDCAHLFGWRVAHFRAARSAHGWRTPVQADGKGFPDLVLAREGDVIFAELKRQKTKLTPEQELWFQELFGGQALMVVWRPSDWVDGTIESALRGEAR